MFTADQVEEILRIARRPYVALFLYGSHARGDYNENSDVDVLQVTPVHTPPYAVGRINFTCYTLKQLLKLARRGSLFARHITDEAWGLYDPQAVLQTLKRVYVSPSNYESVKREVCLCAPLLDATEAEFRENPTGLTSLATYLVRTYLYASAFDRGARTFSMGRILEQVGQQQALSKLVQAKAHPSYTKFVAVRELYEGVTSVVCKRDEDSLEAFIVNSTWNDSLPMILGLRLIARGRTFTYDVLQDVEFEID